MAGNFALQRNLQSERNDITNLYIEVNRIFSGKTILELQRASENWFWELSLIFQQPEW